MKLTRGPLLASLLAVALAAGAVPLKTDPAKSAITAIFKQMNVPVEAKFRKFTAQVDYDAAKPDAAKASVDIDTASLDVGDAGHEQAKWPRRTGSIRPSSRKRASCRPRSSRPARAS